MVAVSSPWASEQMVERVRDLAGRLAAADGALERTRDRLVRGLIALENTEAGTVRTDAVPRVELPPPRRTAAPAAVPLPGAEDLAGLAGGIDISSGTAFELLQD